MFLTTTVLIQLYSYRGHLHGRITAPREESIKLDTIY